MFILHFQDIIPMVADKCQTGFQEYMSRLLRWIVVGVSLGAIAVIASILAVTTGR